MIQKLFFAVMLVWLGGLGLAQAQTKSEFMRGELLYSTHCIGCHSTRLHWRDRMVAKNWASLKAEVDRWQAVSGLRWSEEDVTDVARYLNARHYHFPAPDVGRLSVGDATKLTRPP